MSTLREVLARKDAIRVELRSLLDAHPADMPAEPAARFTVLQAEADGLTAQEARIAAVDDLDRRAGVAAPLGETRAALSAPMIRMHGRDVAPPAAFDGPVMLTQDGARVPVLQKRHKLADFVPATERDTSVGIGGLLRAIYNGPKSDVERRVLGESVIGAGGVTVPAPLAAGVFDLLRANSVAFQAGAQTVPMDSLTLKFVRLLSDPVGAWRNENSPIKISDPAFGGVVLTAKTWALQTIVSRELLEDGQNVDATIQRVFAAAGALALDKAILFGQGSASEPLGIVNTPGVQIIPMGPNGFGIGNYAPFLDVVQNLEQTNAGVVSAMVMSPRTARTWNGLVDTIGQPLQPPQRLAGIPRLVTTSVPDNGTQGTAVGTTSSVILGDFSEVYVGLRTDLQISILNERYAENGQVAFVAWLRADVLLARPAALAVLSGIIVP